AISYRGQGIDYKVITRHFDRYFYIFFLVALNMINFLTYYIRFRPFGWKQNLPSIPEPFVCYTYVADSVSLSMTHHPKHQLLFEFKNLDPDYNIG
ncbi:MAG: hypothetical protein ACRD47_04785, partial [Nitrososphaeraceae archaeon]